jgi:hypothetical protein
MHVSACEDLLDSKKTKRFYDLTRVPGTSPFYVLYVMSFSSRLFTKHRNKMTYLTLSLRLM